MRFAALSLILGVVACDAPTPTPTPTPAPEPVTAPAPVAPVEPPKVEPPPPVEPTPEAPLAGVGPGGAEGRAGRTAAVLAVLGDGEGAAGLRLIASDPGRVFDPALAREMTPTVVVVGSVAAVLQKEARVKGSLDKDLIRRIVRAHINEVRYCYNQGLARDPELGGAITLDFQILATGKVGEGKVLKSTIPDAAVGECMVVAVKRWTFPRPVKEETVEVSYPFVLAPRGTPRSGL